MKIAYTVCSLNRMGQILVLGNSLLHQNPGYTYIIGLADEIEGRIDPAAFLPFKFIQLSELNITDQEKFTSQYDAFELSCALKAFYGDYIRNKFNPELLLYFDTDIKIYGDFKPIEEALSKYSILLSPHYISPVPDDGKIPREREVLNSGIYNGGFIGMRNDSNTGEFLTWWRKRLYDQGYNNVCEGMMVDQLWLNLVPLYFHNVFSFADPGCNVAYWNLHERSLRKEGGNYFVNDRPLVFFHYSGYRLNQPGKLSVHQNRFNADQIPVIRELVKDYQSDLERNNYERYQSLRCTYDTIKSQKKPGFLKSSIIRFLASVGYKLEKIRKIN